MDQPQRGVWMTQVTGQLGMAWDSDQQAQVGGSQGRHTEGVPAIARPSPMGEMQWARRRTARREPTDSPGIGRGTKRG